MSYTLRPFQEEGVRFLAERRRAILGDEQGLGKTAQTIRAAAALGAKRVLVICPAVAKYVWAKEIVKWAPEYKYHIVSSRKEVIPDEDGFTIVNYDLTATRETFVYTQLKNRKFAIGICDEAHYLKNPKAQRTQRVLSKVGIIQGCAYRWLLTGTAIPNRPIDIFPLLASTMAAKFLAPYETYVEFGKRYCAGFWDGTKWDFSGSSNLDELRERIAASGVMLRRLKSDVAPELPARRFQLIPLDMDEAPTVKNIRKTELSFDSAKRKSLRMDGAELAEFYRALGKLKAREVIAALETEFVNSDGFEKTVIFAWHKETMDDLYKYLEQFGVARVDGSTKAEDRSEAERRFQEDPECKFFLGNVRAAGVAITLTAAARVIFVENPWSAGDISQAIDRCHRIGQDKSVLVQFYVTRGLLDEHMLATMVEKFETIDTALPGGDGGIHSGLTKGNLL